MSYKVSAIMMRDIRILARTSWYFIPLVIVNLLVMQYVTMGGILKPDTPLDLQEMILKGLIGYTPIMVIPFLGNMIFSKTMIEERMRQTLVRTMASGIKIRTLWWAKYLLAAIISLLTVLIASLALWILIEISSGVTIHFHLVDVVNIAVVNPIYALAILAIFSSIYWILKKPSSIFFFIPMIIMFGGWLLASSMPLITVFSPMLAIVIIGLSFICIGCNAWICGKVSGERISGLY